MSQISQISQILGFRKHRKEYKTLVTNNLRMHLEGAGIMEIND